MLAKIPGDVIGEITEGAIMSRTYSAVTDENKKNSKVNFQTYFYDTNELHDIMSDDMSDDLEAKLRVSSAPMRREFRRLARRMRAN